MLGGGFGFGFFFFVFSAGSGGGKFCWGGGGSGGEWWGGVGLGVGRGGRKGLSWLAHRYDYMLDDTVVLSLFLVSTFGSGSSPNNVKDLEGELRSIVNWRQPPGRTCGRLKLLKFTVMMSNFFTSTMLFKIIW